MHTDSSRFFPRTTSSLPPHRSSPQHPLRPRGTHLAPDALAQSRYLIASLVIDLRHCAGEKLGAGSACDVRRVERARSSREQGIDRASAEKKVGANGIANLFFQRPDVTIAFYSDDVGAGIARRVAPDERRPSWPRPGTTRTPGGHVLYVRVRRAARRRPQPPPRPRAGSRTRSPQVVRGATRSGRTSPTTSGTTGAGSPRTRSAPSASSATCSPSHRTNWKRSAGWKASTSSPSRRTTSR